MIQVSDSARKELEAYFEGKERSGIRIYVAPSGCSGSRLALALDEANDNDATGEAAGFTFAIEKTLLEQIKSVSIDLTYMGFTVEPEQALPAEEGSPCGSCCSSCGSCGEH
ncbi:MAG: IscA/HesB family protein [Desulfovibrionaceae bacterium]|nr:IscA/HesB family protein [Desulfovibrionaceae bacterium]